MILRVKPTPIGFPTNSLYTPVDNTLLYSISSVGSFCRLGYSTACIPILTVNYSELQTIRLTLRAAVHLPA